MTHETINLILQFMQRVNLSGSEVPAFNQVIAELNRELLIHKGDNDDKSEA